MGDYRVSCVTKPDRNSSHERITELGGKGWTWAVQNIISSIDSGQHNFFTLEGGVRAEVRVIREYGKNPYVRTEKDGVKRNDLLELRACPIA